MIIIRWWRLWRIRVWEQRLRYAQIRMETFKINEYGWEPSDRKYRQNLLEHDCSEARFEVESRKAILWPDPKLLATATVSDQKSTGNNK